MKMVWRCLTTIYSIGRSGKMPKEKIDYESEIFELSSTIMRVNAKVQELEERLAKLETMDDMGGVFTEGVPDYIKSYIKEKGSDK